MYTTDIKPDGSSLLASRQNEGGVMKAALRGVVDRWAPQVAALYRKRRDRRAGRQQPLTTTPWGFSLYGDAGLAVTRHDSHEAERFISLLPDVDRVVDVGANVGLFTLIASNHGVPVTAIEPSPQNLATLYRNLRLNNATAVEVLPVALSSTAGLTDLYGSGQGASLHRGWGGMLSTYTTTVPVHTLDDLLSDRLAGRPVLIKIDAEGAELSILKGAPRMIAGDARWIVEIGLTENFNGIVNPDFKAIFDLFWDAGYNAHCVEVRGQRVTPETAQSWVAAGDRGFWNINYLFTRT